MTKESTSAAATVVERLMCATNAHDIDAITSCFADQYVNETPAHPTRGFTGNDQVRRNWTQILAGVPDLVAIVHALTTDGDDVWAEIEMTGTTRNGSHHAMAGVIIFTIQHGTITAGRFYLEPIDDGPGTVDDNVRNLVSR